MALNVGNLSEVELLPFVAPLWLLSRIGSRVKISHYIQPSNLSSALPVVQFLPYRFCCHNLARLFSTKYTKMVKLLDHLQ